jgi:hypothetical protein
MTVGYSRLTRFAVAAVPAVLVTLNLALSMHPPSVVRMDACFIQREREAPAPTLLPLSDSSLHSLAVVSVWAAVICLVLLPHERVRALNTLAYTSLWFHLTYILLAAIKAPLDDLNCAGRHQSYPNGISGHFCYFVFVSLTVPFIVRARLEANLLPSK